MSAQPVRSFGNTYGIGSGEFVSVVLAKFSDGPTVIAHHLGRFPQGWIVVSPGGDPMVTPAEIGKTETTLTLRSQATQVRTVGLWIF